MPRLEYRSAVLRMLSDANYFFRQPRATLIRMQKVIATAVGMKHDPLSTEYRLCNLPAFSMAATKLIQLSAAEDVELQTIHPVMASDPSLAAEVLRLANSPLFAFRTEVRSIEHAVVLLGLSRIRALAVAIAMRHYSIGPDQATFQKCWVHSLACAVISEELAERYSVHKGDAYTAGLLHDIGRIGLLKAYSNEYIPVLKTEYEKLQENLVLEQCVMRMDHCQSGSFLGKVWAFPSPCRLWPNIITPSEMRMTLV